MAEVSFGEWLKRRRTAEGLTQAQLAEQVNCSTITLRKIEAEERRPSGQIAERLAEIFNIPSGERKAFLRFARGDWRSGPTQVVKDVPWLAPDARQAETAGVLNDLSNSKTHLATFLFTDIEGSAKLWENAPEKMKVALQRHHEILQEAISANVGSVFQVVGDAFCAAFPTVLSAISASISAQQKFHQEQWDLPFPIRVRMGIHTGEAEQTSSGSYASNPTLNRIARILSAAHGGQVLLSLATKDLIKDSLPANTELRDMGEHYLKNLMYPEHLFQLNIAGLPSDFPPLNTLTHRHNLPIQLTSFVAREPELERIQDYLSRDDIRLVTLIGPPGIGKTRLSIEAARISLPDFPDGVFFVALAPLEDSSLIALAIAQALGYVGVKNISTTEQLKEGLGDKHLLLVLDNCEHLIEAVASLAADLLSACPYLKILATSRESLRIPGEWLYAVPAFDVPKESAPLNVENASEYPALTLFAERARAVRFDFSLNTDNIETVAAICARLDGLPLVIELIAARMRLMPPQALLDRLTNQFVLTADGMRAASERQKTLYNAIDWSYKLLPSEEQKLFAYLSVFSGGFSLEAVEAIFSQRVSEKPLPTLIALLLDKSLLKFASNLQESGEARYIMLVTIQEYARERLQEIGEEAEIRNLHLAYFLELAEKADSEIHGPDQVTWMDRLDRELENFRAALNWGLSSRQTEKLLQLLAALSWTWLVRWSPTEYRSWVDKIRALPDLADHPASYARILNGAARKEWIAVNFSEARSFVKESQVIWLGLGPDGERGLAEALYLSGMIPMQEGPYNEAVAYFEQSFDLYQKSDDWWGMAFTRFLLGNVASNKNEDTLALAWLTQSLDLFHELGDPWGMARSAQRLGELFLKQGNYEKAYLYFEQHLEIDEELQLKQGITVALANLGNLYRYQGNDDQAEQYYEKGLAIGREYSLKYEGAFIVYNLGMVALHQNNYLIARSRFLDYFDVARKQHEKLSVCDLLIGLAAVGGGMHEFQRAAKLYGAAQALFETTDYRIPPFDQAEFDRHIRIAREQIGGSKFEELMSEGYAMTMEQAIAYALEAQDD